MSDLVLDQPIRPLLELVGIQLATAAPERLGPLDCGIDEASITGLIGIADAGRTALLELLIGERAAMRGALRFGGLRIDRLGPTSRLRLGIAAMRQRRLAPGGTLASMLHAARATIQQPWWRLATGIGAELSAADREDIAAIVDFLDIDHLMDQPVQKLGGLEARLAELARCLVQRPRLLILEHPLVGLGTEDRRAFARTLRRLREAELAFLMIEDDLATLGGLADRCLVLHRGRLIADASPRAIGESADVFMALAGSAL